MVVEGPAVAGAAATRPRTSWAGAMEDEEPEEMAPAGETATVAAAVEAAVVAAREAAAGEEEEEEEETGTEEG